MPVVYHIGTEGPYSKQHEQKEMRVACGDPQVGAERTSLTVACSNLTLPKESPSPTPKSDELLSISWIRWT